MNLEQLYKILIMDQYFSVCVLTQQKEKYLNRNMSKGNEHDIDIA